MEDTIQFSNMDAWRGGSSGKFGLTFKQICLMHINTCVRNGSVEFLGGYWNETGNNPTIKTYVPNTRDVFNNSVKMLRALLLGYFDKQMKEADTKLKEEFETNNKICEMNLQKGKKILNDWYTYKVEWHMELFEQLIMLSKRLNFFEEESSEEEM